MNELETTKLRFYRLANGLMAIGYLSVFAFVLAQLYKMIF